MVGQAVAAMGVCRAVVLWARPGPCSPGLLSRQVPARGTAWQLALARWWLLPAFLNKLSADLRRVGSERGGGRLDPRLWLDGPCSPGGWALPAQPLSPDTLEARPW